MFDHPRPSRTAKLKPRPKKELTEADVVQIYLLVRSGESQREAGAPYGCSQPDVSAIITGKNKKWRSVVENIEDNL